jgi:hypothetical protein
MTPIALRARLPLAVCAGLTSLLAAQGTYVVPPAYATTAGNTLDREPVAYDQACHVQYVASAYMSGLQPNTLVTGIQYRRASQITNPATLTRTINSPAPLWTLRLKNVPATVNVMSPPATMPGSADTTWTTVLTASISATNFPPLTLPPSGVPDFLVSFPLAAPFVYTGPQFGVQHYVYAAANRLVNYYVDAVMSTTSGGTVSQIPNANGCPPGQNRAQGIAPNPGGGNLEFYLYGAQGNQVAFAALGTNTTQWGSLTLPYSLAPFGLQGCAVYTDLVLPFSRSTDVAGNAELRAAVPADPGLLGARLFGQWVVGDTRVNPAFPIATSDGLQFTLGTTLGQPQVLMSVVSGVGQLAQLPGGGRAGLVQPGRGLIFRLSW